MNAKDMLSRHAKLAGLRVEIDERHGMIQLYGAGELNLVASAYWKARGYEDRRTVTRAQAFKALTRMVVGIRY